jgi:hypothetical protein
LEAADFLQEEHVIHNVIEKTKAKDDVEIPPVKNIDLAENITTSELVFVPRNSIRFHAFNAVPNEIFSPFDANYSRCAVFQGGKTPPAIVTGQVEDRRASDNLPITVDKGSVSTSKSVRPWTCLTGFVKSGIPIEEFHPSKPSPILPESWR